MTPKRVGLLVLLTCFKVTLSTKFYKGEYFPEQYLDPDDELPVEADLEYYIDGLSRIMFYMTENMNYTGISQTMAVYLTNVVLKRTLRDYGHKVESQEKKIKALVTDASNVISHFVYQKKKQKDWSNLVYKVIQILRDDTAHVNSLGNFRSNVPRSWILDGPILNKYVPEMDNLTLPKEKYVQLVEEGITYFNMTVMDSDYCLSALVHNIDPINIETSHPCTYDPICSNKIFASDSVAYTLSHRLLNNLMYMYNRRCYHRSVEFDNRHMDMLCTAMYREVVYIARRGFFSRDLFLEHIGFCGQLGYEEFFRRHWFRKAISWIDDMGCMHESPNFEINRTGLLIRKAQDSAEERKLRRQLKELLCDECHYHLMSVAMIALGSAIRHAAHSIKIV